MRAGLDALVATSAANVEYLTGFALRMQSLELFAGGHPLVGILVSTGPPVLVAPITDMVPAVFRGVTAATRSYGRNYVALPEGAQDLGRDERAVIEALKPDTTFPDAVHAATVVLRDARVRRIGVDDGGAASLYCALAESLTDIECVPAGDTWRRVRAVKDSEEIERLRDAAGIIEVAMEEVWRHTRPGATEIELARRASRVITDAGARPTLWYVGAGAASALVDRLPTSRAIARGDLVMVDFGCEYCGYYADLARTAIVGDPGPRVTERYAAVHAAEAAAIARIRPGRAVADMFDHAVRAARSNGIPRFDRRHVGHGIGLEPYDLPILLAASDDSLEAGMVVNVETPYYEVGFGGLQLEDTLVVTEEGVEFLSGAPRTLRLL